MVVSFHTVLWCNKTYLLCHRCLCTSVSLCNKGCKPGHLASQQYASLARPCPNFSRSNWLTIDKEVFNRVHKFLVIKVPGNIGGKKINVCQIAVKYLTMCLKCYYFNMYYKWSVIFCISNAFYATLMLPAGLFLVWYSKEKNKQLKDLRDFPHAADN